MELPEYTITPCANGGVTLTMGKQAAQAVCTAIGMNETTDVEEIILYEIVIELRKALAL